MRMEVPDFDKRTHVIFQYLSSFNYDKVKEYLDTEKDRSRTNPPSWNLFVNIFYQLNMAEKQYTSLGFLLPKGFLRKDNSLKMIYESLKRDLNKCQEGIIPPKNSFEGWLNLLVSRTMSLVSVRSAMVDLYERFLSRSIEEALMPLEHFRDKAKSIAEEIAKLEGPSSFSFTGNALKYEIGALLNLLEALNATSRWEFFKCLMKIDAANGQLREWNEAIQNSKEEKKISFTSAFLLRPQQDPLLYQWFGKLKGAVLSKFTLYFYDVLSKQASPGEMKNQCSKLPYDYSAKINSFLKKSDAASVNLIFEATGTDAFRGPGYRLPSKFAKPLTGVELYPSAFSCPGPPPLNHWPNIIMILSDFSEKLSSFDKVVHFFDPRVQSTYFLTRIEERIIFVVIYSCDKTDKNSFIANFMLEMSSQLRCKKIFSSLKPGSK